jgi:hypothetical protein
MIKIKETIKKSLEKTYWVNSIGEFKRPSEYPQEFEQKFGNISLNTICFDDYLIDNRKISDFHEFLKNWKFDVTQQYKINEYKSGYYYNDDLCMMIRCGFGLPEDKVEKEEDEMISSESNAYISFSFCPLLKNKQKITKFLNDFAECDYVFI